MDGTSFFSNNPEDGHNEEISRGADAITVTRASGEVVKLDPQTVQIAITDEHAPLEQMGEDWGAVCEVFRQNINTFARMHNFPLHPGDEIVLHYPGRTAEMVLRVIEVEGASARVNLSTR